MMILGVSGGIATGKSLVAERFKMLGAQVFEADSVVHDLYSNDYQVIELVKYLFPDSVINKVINRKKLFLHFLKYSNNWINFQSIIHLLVLNKMKRFIIFNRKLNIPYIILDIPLLIEAKFHIYCDFIVEVSASYFLREQRILKRKLSKEHLQIILSRQINDKERRKYSDFVIKSGLDVRNIYQQIKKILKEIPLKRNTPLPLDLI